MGFCAMSSKNLQKEINRKQQKTDVNTDKNMINVVKTVPVIVTMGLTELIQTQNKIA